MITAQIPADTAMQHHPIFDDLALNLNEQLLTHSQWIKQQPIQILKFQYRQHNLIIKTHSPHLEQRACLDFYNEIACYRHFQFQNFCLPYAVLTQHDSDRFSGSTLLIVPMFDPIQHDAIHTRNNLKACAHIAHSVWQLHQTGYLHGDLKLSHCGYFEQQVKLIDFGHTTRTHANPHIQHHDDIRHNEINGTPAYLSPQRFLGQPLHISDDIYALGIIFYQLLSGSKPFQPLQNTYHAWALAHCQQDIPLLPADVQHLQPILDRMLAKARAHRYPTVDDILTALDVISSSYYGDKLFD